MALQYSLPGTVETPREREQREQREFQRRLREEEAARKQAERQRVAQETAKLTERVNKFMEPVRRVQEEQAKFRQMASQFVRQKEAEKRVNVALEQQKFKEKVAAYLPERAMPPEGMQPVPRPGGLGFGDLIAPLAPKAATDVAAGVLGRYGRAAVETAGMPALAPVSALSRATGINPTIDVAGARFNPLRSGLLPSQAGEAVQEQLTEEGQRILPAATSPVGLGALAAFPAATVAGTAGAIGAGALGGLAEQAGAPSGTRSALELIGGVGPSGVGGRVARPFAEGIEAQGGLGTMGRRLVTEEAGGTRIGHTGFPEEGLDPVQKMTNWMNEQAKPLAAGRRARQAQVAQLHGRQAGILQETFRDPTLTPQQQFQRGLERLPEAGTAGRAEFTPPPISEAETGELFAKIRDYPIWQNRPFKALNAQKGLAQLMNGELPGQYDLGLLEQVFGPEFIRAAAKQSGSKWRQIAVAAGLPRTVRTILDVSWPLRQGAGVLPRHPKEVLGNAPRGVGAFFSERVAQQWDEATRMKPGIVEIVGDDGVPKTWAIGELQDEVGLYLPRIDQEVAPLAERTEEFMATQGGDTWVGKLFGKGIFGLPIRTSQRSFITMGNATRSDIFENTITGRLFNLGKPVTMEDARGLAWLINVATGRGDLGELNRYAALLSNPIFSPRLLAARIEHGLSPAILATGAGGAPRSAKAAALAAQQLVAFVGTGAALAATASQVPGIRSERNPLSTKWGKLEIGFDPLDPLKDTTKIDLFGGYQQYARVIAQLYASKAKSDTGEVYEKDRWRIFEQFVRNKVSPNLGTIWDVLSGETAVGDKVDLKTAAGIRTFLWNEYSPLSFNDIVEAVNRDDGLKPEYAALAPISLSGGGVQTYGGRPSSVINSMPYYEGLDQKAEDELSSFIDEAKYEYQRAKAAGADVSQADVARILGEQTGRKGLGNAAARALQGDLPLNKERIQFAIDHQDELDAKTLLGAVPDAVLRDYLSPENFERVFKR